VIVAAAAVLAPPSFAALAVALALTDLVRGGLLAYDVGAVRLLSAASGTSSPILADHLGAKLIVGTFGTVAVAVFSWLAYDSETTGSLAIISLGTLPAAAAAVALVRRQAAFDLASVSGSVAAASGLGAGIAIVGVALTRDPLATATGIAVGDVATCLLLARELSFIPRPNFAGTVDVIRRSWMLVVMQLAYIGEWRIGAIILGAVGTAIAVAEYTVASRVAEGMVILASALTASSLPLMGRAIGNQSHRDAAVVFVRAYRMSLLVSAVAIAILTLTAPVWIGIAFPRYPGAAFAFIPVGVTVVLYFSSSQTTAFLNARRQDRMAATSATAGSLVATVASLRYAPLGAVGIGVGRVFAELVRLAAETGAVIRGDPALGPPIAKAWLYVTPALLGSTAVAILGWSAPAVAVAMIIVVLTLVLGAASLVNARSRT
jgi:O-antigen/teichoic acid export membrane protein